MLLLGLLALSTHGASTNSSTRFRFRLPEAASFRIDEASSLAQSSDWVSAWPENGSTNCVEFGNRVVLQLKPGTRLNSLLAGHPLVLARTVASNLFIVQAPNALTAAREAHRLAALPEVTASYPVISRPGRIDGPYAPAPNDPHFPPALGNVIGQWYLENRDPLTGASLGVDLNVRAAWPFTRGAGVTIAIADVGVEISHPDLVNRTAGAPHHNFNPGATNVFPFGKDSFWSHGTSCAGLAAAEANNHYGMSGVAHESRLASWVIFRTNKTFVSDEQLMEMFQFASNTVSVQSHSWTHANVQQQAMTPLEQTGLANAIEQGRGGRGVVIVRAAGNDRPITANANDDGYTSDPRVITVGAVTRAGRAASYSEPGACLLLAAPSGESGSSGLFSTDLTGPDGGNPFGFFPPFEYLANFVFNSLGFSGTSASAPLVAGVAALVLSANTNLTYRDVQQILLLSCRQADPGDPDLVRNGAGLLVSHNTGFGVPDAGVAVRLARSWSNRPPLATITLTTNRTIAVPDDGLRLVITGSGVPANLASIHALSGTGPHPDTPTPSVPLVDVGFATNSLATNLAGKAVLIQRGTNSFPEKVNFAAEAGAAFAVIYNLATNTSSGFPGGDQLCLPGGLDFTPIPAVFIGYGDGIALQGLFATNSNARAQLFLNSTGHLFAVTNTLSLEQVGVRVLTDHPLRGDLRITLVSPAGTRSVLQRFNSDTNAGPRDWTYWSTHHFYESSAGEWRLEISDEFPGAVGSLLSASLILRGVPIIDTDTDGLDDRWELAGLGTLAYGSKDDPDRDGYRNAREQVMGTNPEADVPLQLDLSRWNDYLFRLSWPGSTNKQYQVWSGTTVRSLSLITNVPGRFPETEWFVSATNSAQKFFQVRTTLR